MIVSRLLYIFDDFPEEAKIIGRILAGYGELEFALSTLLGAVLDSLEMAVNVLFRFRSEEQRIEIADTLMREKMEPTSLAEVYTDAIADMSWCRRIRNQYAHCHFSSHNKDSLYFVSLEYSAKKTRGRRVKQHRVDVPLLTVQEDYFCFVLSSLYYLDTEYLKLVGKPSNRDWTKPPKLDRPLLRYDKAEQ